MLDFNCIKLTDHEEGLVLSCNADKFLEMWEVM